MASPPSSSQPLGDRSYFKPTVSLYDWWLIKSEEDNGEKLLAVAGVSSSPDKIPRRVFHSAPISKKVDVFTLETTDGVNVILDGFINRENTIANGFSDKIVKRFQLGFYGDWEKSVAEFLRGDSNAAGVSGGISGSGSEGVDVNISSPMYVPFRCRSNILEGYQKNPMSGYTVNHKNTKLLPSSDAFESAGGASGTAVQSKVKTNEPDIHLSNSAPRGTRFLSDVLSIKRMNQLMVGNGSNSRIKTKESDVIVSETVNISERNDRCEAGGKGVESSTPTFLYPSLEEDSHEQVSREDMCDDEFPKQMSSKLSFNNSINDLEFDYLVDPAADEEIDKDDFGSTSLQCTGILKTFEGNEKSSESGCLTKHDSTKVGTSKDEDVAASGPSRVLAVETVSNTSQTVACTGGGRNVLESFLSCCERAEVLLDSSLTSVHSTQETSHEKVDLEDRLDGAEQIFTNLSSESIINDLVNIAADVGRPHTREENEKNPASKPASQALESLDGACNANSQSGGEMDISERSTSQFTGRVSQLFSGIISRKWKKKQTVGNGLKNTETNTIDSDPAVSGTVSNTLQTSRTNVCETEDSGMSCPSYSELQEPMDVNVARKLDFDFLEDDLQQTSNATEGQGFGNVTEVGEGENGAKEENKLRKRNRRQVTTDTQEVHVTVEGNKRKSTTPSTLVVKKKIGETSEVNKNGKVSLFTSDVRKKSTPLTPEVNSNEEVSCSTSKVNTKKRKASPFEVSRKRPLTRSTQEVNTKKDVSHSTAKANTKNRKASPSTMEVSRKSTIMSPESLIIGRSRSGRLQLPPLEFWRNQSPIYDKDHGLIGIQDELPRIPLSRGSRSEPRKRKANRG